MTQESKRFHTAGDEPQIPPVFQQMGYVIYPHLWEQCVGKVLRAKEKEEMVPFARLELEPDATVASLLMNKLWWR